MITTEAYWRKTGAKFMGSDEEFRLLLPDCNNSMPITDEEGYFNNFYCCIDWALCDKICNKHRPPINPLIEEFFKRACENENTNTL